MQPAQTQHIQNFVKLVAKLGEHNNSYGSGAQFARAVKGAIQSALGGEESRGIQQEISRPTRDAEAIFRTFSATLYAMGLELVQNRGQSDDTLSFEVNDSAMLVRFFQSTTLRDLEGEGVKSAVDFLAKALDDGFVHQYGQRYLDPPVETWKELQDPLLEVASELTRLNLKEASQRITLHVALSLDGTLEEYLIADSKDLLVNTGGFNARRWHNDTTPEVYTKNWEDAVAAARIINENPKAVRIFDQVYKFLKESAEFAQEEIKKNIANPPPEYRAAYWREGGPEKLETLQKVLLELATLRPEQDE